MLEEKKKFRLHVPSKQINLLKKRLNNSILPDNPPMRPWIAGMDFHWMNKLLKYWIDEFNWRKQEVLLNKFNQFEYYHKGFKLHYIYEKGIGENSIPLLLLHGWPGSLFEFIEIIPMLNDPKSFGIKSNLSFDIIAPSLPGYGLSYVRNQKRIGVKDISKFLHRFMLEDLRINKFGIQGGDWGSFIGSTMSSQYFDNVIGLHLNFLAISRDIKKVKNPDKLTKKYYSELRHWKENEMGYLNIQSTKPQTLAYALSDSPLGLAAWIAEKFYSWTDCNGIPEKAVSFDRILSNICLYWFTGSIGSSFWPYYDRHQQGYSISPTKPVLVPVGYASFPKEITKPPKSIADKTYKNIISWSNMKKGGHFAALECPKLLAQDICSFYSKV